MKSIFSGALDKARAALNTVSETATAMGGRIAEAAGDAVETVRETKVGAMVAETAQTVGAKVGEAADAVKDSKVGGIVASAAETVTDAAADTGARLARSAKAARDAFSKDDTKAKPE